ncbi:MAG: glycosyltransferase family 2 protein [Solirubrobacteraceae bacterium]
MAYESPRVTVVLPLTGGPSQALRCLEGLSAQPSEPSFEVVVVDDASVGLESLLARLDGDVEVVRTQRRVGFAAAFALGAQRAHGSIVVMLRGAAAPSPGWLVPLAAAMDDPAIGVAVSATVGDAHTSVLAGWSAALRATALQAIDLSHAPDALVLATVALTAAQLGLRVVSVNDSLVSPPGTRTGTMRRAPGESPELTIVIPTLDARSERVQRCLGAIEAATDVAHEIVIVDNGAPPQGFSEPVNAGIRAARSPYIVVMNDDVQPLAEWWRPLRTALDGGAAVAFPLTVDGPMRFDFAAWCFAISRAAVEEYGHAPGAFLDPELTIWYQDTDLLYRLRQRDRAPVFVESSRILHGLSETVATDDPELSAWVATQVVADRKSFLRKHPDAVLHGHALAPG